MATEVGAGAARCGAAAGTGPGGTEPRSAPAARGWGSEGCGEGVGGGQDGTRVGLGAGVCAHGWVRGWGRRGVPLPEGAVRGWGAAPCSLRVGQVAGGDATPHEGYDVPLAPPSSSPSPLRPAAGGAGGGSHPARGAGAGRALPIPFVPPFPCCAAAAELLLQPPARLVALLLLGTEGCPHAGDTPGDAQPRMQQPVHTGTSTGPTPGAPWGNGTAAGRSAWGPSPWPQPPGSPRCPLAPGAQPAGAAAQRVPGHQGLCAAGLQRWDHVPVPDKVPPRAGEPGREPSGVCGGGALFSVPCGAWGVGEGSEGRGCCKALSQLMQLDCWAVPGAGRVLSLPPCLGFAGTGRLWWRLSRSWHAVARALREQLSREERFKWSPRHSLERDGAVQGAAAGQVCLHRSFCPRSSASSSRRP